MAETPSALDRASVRGENFPGHDFTAEEVAWLRAVEGECRRLGKVSLTPAEALALAKRLGYRRP